MTLVLALLTSCLSFAYIPEYSLLTSRTADQHGRGSFMIEQDVTYRKDSESFTVKETWLINGETSMRVTLEGRGALKGLVTGSMVYDGAQKFFVESSSPSVRAGRLGDEWLEPLFHFRNSKFFRHRLVSLKVAPAESLYDRPPLRSDTEPKYDSPSFIRLSRVGGSVAWAIGLPPNSEVHPAVWIEQDQFVLRKYRSANQVIVKADDYNKYDDGLWFPRLRSYNFGNMTVTVQTLQVKSLGKLKSDDPRFKASGLNAARDGLKLPDADALKEFYSRFR